MKLNNLKKIGFGDREEREVPYENYLNEFVIVTKHNGNSFGGKYIGISKEGNMIFNPHDAIEYGQFGRRKNVVNKNREIKPSSVEDIEEISEESLREYCVQANLDEIRIEQKKTDDFLKSGSSLISQIFSINGSK